MAPRTIVVAGSLAQRPLGGHAWVFLNHLLGFRSLGYEVLFVDRLEPGMCVDGAGEPSPFATSANVAYLASVMERAGLGGCWTVRYDGGKEVAGVSHEGTVAALQRSDLLLNVMGYLDEPELLDAAPLRAFLDIDPGFGQMWCDLGQSDLFAGHDRHVTIGEGIGGPGCTIPTCGIDWITTKQPVALDAWPATPAGRGHLTTIGTWRGPFGPIEHGGRTYGLRAHELRRFLDLPARTGLAIEALLAIDASDQADIDALRAHGWDLADPGPPTVDPWTYQATIARSMAELMVAKNLYVQSRSGWFSDRSACFLASGRAVLAQDTGLAGHLPSGEGLLFFSTIEEAEAGAAAIAAEPERHGRAARAIAEEHFDARRVLGRLLDRLGVA
jgi:hypothetical protein